MRTPHLFLIAGLAAGAFAQAPLKFTADDYARAEKFMGYNTNPLVYGTVRPNWIDPAEGRTAERCWYRVTRPEGSEFILVDPGSASKRPAFDHARLAAALSKTAGSTYDAKKLPFNDIDLSGSDVLFNLNGKRWKCDAAGDSCVAEGNAQGGGRGRGGRGGGFGGGRAESVSPDKKRAVFIRENNLWSREIATNKETQLTTDGVKDFGYATDNAGWATSDRPIVAWSPGFEKDRDVPAGPARRGRNVPGEHHSGPSGPEGLEISAAGR